MVDIEGKQVDQDPGTALRLLLEVDSLLKQNSYQAKRAFERLVPILIGIGAQELLEEAQAHLDRMDLSSARKSLRPLVEIWRNSVSLESSPIDHRPSNI
jgi:hypothetical protein